VTRKTLDEIIASARTSCKVVPGTQDWVAPDEKTIVDVAQVIVALKDRLDQAEELLAGIVAPCGLVWGLHPTVPDFLAAPFVVNGVVISD
jgi:hypothetical protein